MRDVRGHYQGSMSNPRAGNDLAIRGRRKTLMKAELDKNIKRDMVEKHCRQNLTNRDAQCIVTIAL